MTIDEVLSRWGELDDAESWGLVALVRIEVEPDDEFPYDASPIVDLVVETDDQEIDFVIRQSASEADSAVSYSLGEALQALAQLPENSRAFEIFIRAESDAEGYTVAVDTPVVATGANPDEKVFAFFPWFEGFDEFGLFPE